MKIIRLRTNFAKKRGARDNFTFHRPASYDATILYFLTGTVLVVTSL